MNHSPDILFMAEYIKNVLYFATVRQGKTLKSTIDTHYFNIDNELVYENYYSDFGPLNLGCVYRYCKTLNEKINQFLNKQTIVHYTSAEPKRKTNSAFLLGCYGVLYLSLTPRDALRPLMVRGQNYRAFQDVTQGDSAYTITLLDCLQAIKKARDLGFFNFHDFDYDEYNRLDKIHGGDLNWIVPGKFLAFIGPVDTRLSLYHPPEMYIDYFLENNVKIVIRLNKRMYDGDVFNDVGIYHYDLFFPDGSHPPRNIMFKFLQISEEADCAIAVHCKAGLGRTGSLIGSYLIKHYRMTSHEAIGWMRICRPGSVIGHQQAWLEKLEVWLMKQGNLYRKRMYQDSEKFPHHEFGIYSFAERNMRNRSAIFQKPLSPTLPHGQRKSNIMSPPHPTRPQNSRIKEALNKAAEKERDWRLKLFMMNSSPTTPYLGDQSDVGNTSNRGCGSGDPKSVRITRQSTMRSIKEFGMRNDLHGAHNAPISPHHESQTPIIKTVKDARDYLMRSSNCIAKERREHELASNIMVNPYSYQMQSPIPAYGLMNKLPPPHSPHRRRLGRSPSPLSVRVSPEQHKSMNTQTEKCLVKDASVPTVKNVYARFTTSGSNRPLSSVGAVSMGTNRVTPTPKRPPRVRSDERPLATQGDVLNSIKFQRRCRESLNAEKAGVFDKNSVKVKKTLMPPASIRNMNSKVPNLNKPSPTLNSSSHVSDKPIAMMRSFFSPQRPMSPKGRRNTQTY